MDVVSGVLAALVFYTLVAPLTARYDLYQQTQPLAPLLLLATSLALCTICYPSAPSSSSPAKTSAKGDAVTITAVVVGLGMGSWLNCQLGLSSETSATRLPVAMPTLGWLCSSLLQFVVGVAVAIAVKTGMKWVSLRFFTAFFGLDSVDSQHPGVMVGYKYTTYLCLGLTIGFIDPLIFTALGFGRPGYYQEIS